MYSLKYLLLVLVFVSATHADTNNNKNNTESKVTKISWYSDQKKDEKVEQNVETKKNDEKSVESVKVAIDKKNETTTETKNKDLTLEQLLKNLEDAKKTTTTTPSSSSSNNDFRSSNDYNNNKQSFPYAPFHPEDPYNEPYDDYPPVPPPYPYTYPSAPSVPEFSGYAPAYYADDYPFAPSAWFDPNYYPDETFGNENNDVNNYLTTDEENHKENDRFAKSVDPVDYAYNWNEPLYLHKPCGEFNNLYKRHALPPFGEKDENPLKLDLPTPHWIEKLKELREEMKSKDKKLDFAHALKQRSTDDDDNERPALEFPLPASFNSDKDSDSSFGQIFLRKNGANGENDEFFS